MAILDFVAEAQKNASNNTQRPTNNSDRPKAKLWLNIGYEVNGKFVNLPVGIPLDTMEPVQARGQNVDWVQFQTARNELLKALQAAGDQLEPGAEMVIPTLEIRVRHTANELTVAPEDNAYSADFTGLFANATVKAPAVNE